MSNIFRIQVLPAQRGDALWIEYGDSGNPHRILIDGGITRTGRDHLRTRVAALGAAPHLDLLVVTHIDLDHIQGIITLLKELPPGTTIDRIWFNGRNHLPEDPLEPQGPLQGLELMEVLTEKHSQAWNRDAAGGAIAINADGSPRVFSMPGDMKITVLSPDNAKLIELRREWDEVVEAFGAEEEDIEEEGAVALPAGLEGFGAEDVDIDTLADVKFTEDKKAANGSSIAMLLEFAGQRALMLGDAHPSLVLKSLQKLSPGGPLDVACVKLSHHGSRNNTHKELIKQLRTTRWIFSSNGAQTKHPNQEAVARVLKFCPNPRPRSLIFNYRTDFNKSWDDDDLRNDNAFTTQYGDETNGVLVNLL